MDAGELPELKRELADKLEYGEARRPEFGPIWLNIQTKTLHRAGTDKVEKLSDHEYQILWMLIRAQGKNVSVVEMDEFIMESSPETADIPVSNTRETEIYKIRTKLLGLVGNKVKIITNVRGTHEYRLELA